MLLTIMTISSSLIGCASDKDFDSKKDISVVSREEGSGTRGAFVELFDIQEEIDGSKKDLTTKEAIIAKQTDVMMTNINQDIYGIGYASMGSLNDSIKAVKINDIDPTPENIKAGTYEIARPFQIATKGDGSEVTQDFIKFILSAQGQEVVSDNYIPIMDNAADYTSNSPSGKIVIAGSSSVTPVMEKLKEAYLKINANAQIEIQQSDSSAGMTGAIEGSCDIGMASRDLKDSELAELTATTIALDGIAIITNTDNPISTLTKEQVKSIFTGETTNWSDIIE